MCMRAELLGFAAEVNGCNRRPSAYRNGPVRLDFPASLFECVPHSARSTKAEAAVFVPLLRKMGVKHYILFSSDFHTRRAGKLFRAEGPELEVTVIGAVHPQLNMSTWWTERETVKTVWAEMQKTITGPLGL